MSELESFRHQVGEKVASLKCAGTEQSPLLRQQMATLESRLGRFDQTAAALVNEILLPRLQVVASFFPNAYLKQGKRHDECELWFGYCERFPASVKQEFSCEHDDAIEHLVIYYSVRISPVFLKYDPGDKLVVPLDQVNRSEVAEWVEKKLLAFLDDYHRLDRGDESLDDELSTDPVCGMQVRRADSAGQFSYRGHLYSFCTEECQTKFEKEPSRYVWFHE